MVLDDMAGLEFEPATCSFEVGIDDLIGDGLGLEFTEAICGADIGFDEVIGPALEGKACRFIADFDESEGRFALDVEAS